MRLRLLHLMKRFTVVITCLFGLCDAQSMEENNMKCEDGVCMNTMESILRALRNDLWWLMEEHNCNPLMLRLAFHDAGTYDKNIGIGEWPRCGGANGSLRFRKESSQDSNAGMAKAINLLKHVKVNYQDSVSWADIIQMAGAVAVEHALGPKIPMRYGRLDVESEDDCSLPGNLPTAQSPYPNEANSPQQHLRDTFYRMGLEDRDIVSLSGAHTIGRAHAKRSGLGKERTRFTTGIDIRPRGPIFPNGLGTYGIEGGSSWTENWLVFDNAYFINLVNEVPDEELLRLGTDQCLMEDETFRSYVNRYASNKSLFFVEYAEAHSKMSELGAKFDPPEGITFYTQDGYPNFDEH